MRVILNTKLFKQFDFISHDEMKLCFSLIEVFSERNSYNIDLKIDDSKIVNLNFLFTKNENTIALNKDYVKLFTNNTENVRKFREKNKEEEIIEIKVEKIKKTVEKIDFKKYDYEKIIKLYNEKFKDTESRSVTKLTNAIVNKINKLFEKMSEKVEDKLSIEEFYDIYFEEAHSRKGIREGWLNTKSNTHFQPGFDFLMRENTFENIFAKGSKYYT